MSRGMQDGRAAEHQQQRPVRATASLRRGARTGEKVLGVLTVAAVYLVPAWSISHGIGWWGIAVAAGLLVLVLAWQWFHLGASGRRPWTRVERVLSSAAALAVTLPMTRLIWPTADDRQASGFIAPALPTVLLAAFLMLRWRQDD